MNNIQCSSKETKPLYVRLGSTAKFSIRNAKLLLPFRERNPTLWFTAQTSRHEQRRFLVQLFYLHFTLNGKWGVVPKKVRSVILLKVNVTETKEGCSFNVVIRRQDQRNKTLNLAAVTRNSTWKLILTNFTRLSLPCLKLQRLWV
jgi:hypothetical protein